MMLTPQLELLVYFAGKIKKTGGFLELSTNFDRLAGRPAEDNNLTRQDVKRNKGRYLSKRYHT
jgi:hypothetical protein